MRAKKHHKVPVLLLKYFSDQPQECRLAPLGVIDKVSSQYRVSTAENTCYSKHYYNGAHFSGDSGYLDKWLSQHEIRHSYHLTNLFWKNKGMAFSEMVDIVALQSVRTAPSKRAIENTIAANNLNVSWVNLVEPFFLEYRDMLNSWNFALTTILNNELMISDSPTIFLNTVVKGRTVHFVYLPISKDTFILGAENSEDLSDLQSLLTSYDFNKMTYELSERNVYGSQDYIEKLWDNTAEATDKSMVELIPSKFLEFSDTTRAYCHAVEERMNKAKV